MTDNTSIQFPLDTWPNPGARGLGTRAHWPGNRFLTMSPVEKGVQMASGQLVVPATNFFILKSDT